MSFENEPLLPQGYYDEPVERKHLREDVAKRIRSLVSSQPFGVLCTQGNGQPYGSLVAFAMRDDFCYAAFATSRATRKYRLLSECENVALLIDNRSEYCHELMKVEAVTATGRAKQIESDKDFQLWASLLTDRHPYLKNFVKSSSCGLFQVEILRYLYVFRFQEVREWIPAGNG